MRMLLGIFHYLSLLAFTQTSISPGLREYAFEYIKAFPCPFNIQHRSPSSLSIEKSLLATRFTFLFCLRICCALPIQVISKSLSIGFFFNSSEYSFPSRSIPSKQTPSIVCLEANSYSSRQSIAATTLLISPFAPRQYFRKSKIIDVSITAFILRKYSFTSRKF